jgi:mRNA interferase MazF
MPKGEIILIPFPFTNLTDTKMRPCLVLIKAEYDVTISFITTQTGWNDKAALAIKPSPSNGLKKESLIRLNKLATLDKELVIGKIGVVNKAELTAVNQKLKEVLQL